MNKGLNNLKVFILVCLTCSLLLVSCKSKAVLVDAKTPIAADSIVTAEKVIQNHYGNKIDFSTLYIRASAKYKHEDNS